MNEEILCGTNFYGGLAIVDSCINADLMSPFVVATSTSTKVCDVDSQTVWSCKLSSGDGCSTYSPLQDDTNWEIVFGTPDADVITVPDYTAFDFFDTIQFVKKHIDWVNDVWETGEVAYIVVGTDIKFFSCVVDNSYNC